MKMYWTKFYFGVAFPALVLILFGLFSPAHAAKMDGAPSADCDGLKIASGPAGKGYSKLFSDLKRVGAGTINLCEVNTTGGLDNLTALSEKKADVGIVQIDTIKAMSSGDESIASLQAVVPLNYNYLHVVTTSTGFTVEGAKKMGGLMAGDKTVVRLTAFSQLRGKPVALVGSAQLLGRQLEKQLGFGMRFYDVKTDDQAFEMVKKGQAWAALTVSGWPHGAVKRLDQSSGLTLIPFDVSTPNGSYVVKPYNYKNIGVYNVNALAIQNVLVTRPFAGKKIQEVAKLKKLIADNLTELKDGDYEPAWNEIKNVDATVDLPRFKGQ